MLKLVFAGTALVAAGPAFAADNAMQVCAAKYQAAKTGKTLPAGQTWPQYLSACRGTLPKAVTTPAAAATKAAGPKAAGQRSPAQIAAQQRQKQCSANYQADKAANKLAGQTWPKYYGACAAKLKG